MNMNANKIANAYYNIAAGTLPKTRQVVMLYDGAIGFLKQAQEAAEVNDEELHFTSLSKVYAILSGLQSSLDYKSGGDISRILDNFYSTILTEVNSLFAVPDAKKYEVLAGELLAMRSSWATIDSDLVELSKRTANVSSPTINMGESFAGNMVFSA